MYKIIVIQKKGEKEMEENQENKAEELKQETVNTFNQAKEQMKNINLKEEAEIGKGLLKKLWKNPVETIKEVVNDNENKVFKTALILVGVWAIVELLKMILMFSMSEYADFEFLPTLKVTVAPILKVIAMALALYFVNNRVKDSITKSLTSVTIAHVPGIIASIIGIISLFAVEAIKIISPIISILNIITAILMYFTVKAYAKEENEENAVKKFILVQAVFYLIRFVISYLGISI